MIEIIFPDKKSMQFPKGITSIEIAKSISNSLAKEILAVRVNNEIWDISRPIEEDSSIQFYTWEDEKGKKAMWHSSAHLMAEVLFEFYPNIKFGVGPAIDTGFYYDVYLPGETTISENDFGKIEKRILELAKLKLPFKREVLSTDEAKKLFSKLNQDLKLELISELKDATITTYKQGNFIDLCKGPHLPHTGYIKAVKLLNIAGAYWKGDEKNKQLLRIYGVSFPKQKMLEEHLKTLEDAKNRDHKKIGKELELFTSSDLVGKGFPLLLPKGATLRRILERFIVDEELKRGYQHVYTPSIARKKIYEISGHWELYKDGMYPIMDIGNDKVVLRPMTCPHHFMIYSDKPKSYRDLPVRIAELAQQYRKEQSGEVSGLVRVMTFTLADSHIFCRSDQVAEEFKGAIELIQYSMKCLGLTSRVSYRASLRDNSKNEYVDNPIMWDKTQKFLIETLNNIGLEYKIAEGHAAFYGPKLDIQMKNVYGKEDTVFTVQIDFALPERFDINYTDQNGEKQRPVVVHRSSVGSIERTMSFLIEHYAGAFPLWLSPVQVILLNISEAQYEYTKNVGNILTKNGIRIEKDLRNEKIGKKLREARLQKVPYIVIIGDKEMELNKLTVRNRNTGNQKIVFIDNFINNVIKENNSFALDLNADVL